jgi:hypothetical protein
MNAQQSQLSILRGRARRLVGHCKVCPERVDLPPEVVRRLANLETGWANDPESFFEMLRLAGWATPANREAIEWLFTSKE